MNQISLLQGHVLVVYQQQTHQILEPYFIYLMALFVRLYQVFKGCNSLSYIRHDKMVIHHVKTQLCPTFNRDSDANK